MELNYIFSKILSECFNYNQKYDKFEFKKDLDILNYKFEVRELFYKYYNNLAKNKDFIKYYPKSKFARALNEDSNLKCITDSLVNVDQYFGPYDSKLEDISTYKQLYEMYYYQTLTKIYEIDYNFMNASASDKSHFPITKIIHYDEHVLGDDPIFNIEYYLENNLKTIDEIISINGSQYVLSDKWLIMHANKFDVDVIFNRYFDHSKIFSLNGEDILYKIFYNLSAKKRKHLQKMVINTIDTSDDKDKEKHICKIWYEDMLTEQVMKHYCKKVLRHQIPESLVKEINTQTLANWYIEWLILSKQKILYPDIINLSSKSYKLISKDLPLGILEEIAIKHPKEVFEIYDYDGFTKYFDIISASMDKKETAKIIAWSINKYKQYGLKLDYSLYNTIGLLDILISLINNEVKTDYYSILKRNVKFETALKFSSFIKSKQIHMYWNYIEVLVPKIKEHESEIYKTFINDADLTEYIYGSHVFSNTTNEDIFNYIEDSKLTRFLINQFETNKIKYKGGYVKALKCGTCEEEFKTLCIIYDPEILLVGLLTASFKTDNINKLIEKANDADKNLVLTVLTNFGKYPWALTAEFYDCMVEKYVYDNRERFIICREIITTTSDITYFVKRLMNDELLRMKVGNESLGSIYIKTWKVEPPLMLWYSPSSVGVGHLLAKAWTEYVGSNVPKEMHENRFWSYMIKNSGRKRPEHSTAMYVYFSNSKENKIIFVDDNKLLVAPAEKRFTIDIEYSDVKRFLAEELDTNDITLFGTVSGSDFEKICGGNHLIDTIVFTDTSDVYRRRTPLKQLLEYFKKSIELKFNTTLTYE